MYVTSSTQHYVTVNSLLPRKVIERKLDFIEQDANFVSK